MKWDPVMCNLLGLAFLTSVILSGFIQVVVRISSLLSLSILLHEILKEVLFIFNVFICI